MNRYTKIICTLGPACAEEDMMVKMAERGMNVARINGSHGTKAQHQKFVDRIRKINKQHGFKVGILLDLAGYRIRIGLMKKNKILVKDKTVFISNEEDQGEDHIPFDYTGDVKIIEKGAHIFIDDGRLHLRVTGFSGKKLKCKIIQGGNLKERKGINIPTLKLHSNIMTDQDQKSLKFALDNNLECVAQSFVRNKKDIQRVVDIVHQKIPECKVITMLRPFFE